MKYKVQRVLIVNDEMFKIGDWILINNNILAKLKEIYFADEYTIKIVTNEGNFLLDDNISIERVKE